MTVLIHAEKASDKTQHPFVVKNKKTLKKVRIEGNLVY